MTTKKCRAGRRRKKLAERLQPSCGGEPCQGVDTMIEDCPTCKNIVTGHEEDCVSTLENTITGLPGHGLYMERSDFLHDWG